MREDAERSTVLITGACGYVGAALVRYLATQSHSEFRLLDNLSRGTPNALRNLPAGPTYRFYEADILDSDLVRIALDGVDSVVHLAAIVQPPLSFAQPQWLEQNNHWGTANLVDHCIEAGVKRFIYLSTSAVYGPCESATEEAVCRPLGPFAQSMLRAEKSVHAANVRGLAGTVLRTGSVFGASTAPRFDEFVNRFAYLAGIGKPLTIYGDGAQRRPIVHVEDVCSAVDFVLSRKDTRHATYNLLENNYSVQEIADLVLAAKQEVRVRYTEQDLRTRYDFVVDGSKLKDLGWEAERTARDSLVELMNSFAGFSQMPAGDADLLEP